MGRKLANPGTKRALDSARLVLDVIGGIATIGGIVGLVASWIGDFSFDYNPTEEYAALFNAKVVPELDFAEQLLSENSEFVAHASLDQLAAWIVTTVKSQHKEQEVVRATEVLDEIIRCKTAHFCVVNNYGEYEQVIRRFWYTFRPFLLEERKNQISTFSLPLQAEAERVLAIARANGNLSKT